MTTIIFTAIVVALLDAYADDKFRPQTWAYKTVEYIKSWFGA